MWRVAILAGLTSLGVVTPGVVLAGIQAWAPVVLAAATLAGSSLAVALAAYHKSRDNAARLTAVERKLPKRSTDAAPIYPPNGVPAMPGATGRAAVAAYTTATLPPEGGRE